jgi:hypothetical protein
LLPPSSGRRCRQDGKTISGENNNEINETKPIGDVAVGSSPLVSFAGQPLAMI